MTDEINSSSDVIDSRDVIARIEELEGNEERTSLETEELEELWKLAEAASSSPDWLHGEALINDDYFVEYTEELIKDCYEMPKDLNSGAWPWCHMSMDYEAAAEALKVDYFDVQFRGETFWIRG